MRISDWSSDVCSSDLVAQLAGLLKSVGGTEGVSAAQFRDATGLGRKRSIQILEFFDRAGYTRRLRDKHEIGRASCRERVCQYVEISVVAASLTKKYTMENSD